MAATGENRWPPVGRTRWPLTQIPPAGQAPVPARHPQKQPRPRPVVPGFPPQIPPAGLSPPPGPSPQSSSPFFAKSAPRPACRFPLNPALAIPLRYLASHAAISVKPAAAPFLQLSPNAPAQRPAAEPGRRPPRARPAAATPRRRQRPASASGRSPNAHLCRRALRQKPLLTPPGHERHRATFTLRTPENTGFSKVPR